MKIFSLQLISLLIGVALIGSTLTDANVVAYSKVEENKRSYAHCFGTSQFLFVGFANCHLTSERSPPPRLCPYHTLYQASTYSQSQWDCAHVRIHLLLGSNIQPQVLIIGASRDYGYMVAQLKPISWPEDEPLNNYRFHKELVDTQSAHTHIDDILYSEMVATILDNRYGLLYVLRNNSLLPQIECILFFVVTTSEERMNFVRIGTFEVHHNNDRRLLWTQDPYTLKVYYAERSIDGERMLIYSLPFQQLMDVLVNGHGGTLERILLGTRNYLSVSKGIAISYSTSYGIVKQYVHRINDTSEVILCEQESTRSHLDPAAQLTLIFNEDYCKVRDQKGIVENCEEETLVEIAERRNDEQSEYASNKTIFWCLLVIPIVCTVIFVLIICVVKQRKQNESRSFIKVDRPHVQYYPTFISDSSTDF